jgi:hypothetical protein
MVDKIEHIFIVLGLQTKSVLKHKKKHAYTIYIDKHGASMCVGPLGNCPVYSYDAVKTTQG